MTSTTLTGFGMAKDLDFGADVRRRRGRDLRRAAGLPRRHQLRHRVSSSTAQYATDGGKSTIEVVNLMLGSGNDRLDIQGTLAARRPGQAHGHRRRSATAGAYAGVPTGTDATS